MHIRATFTPAEIHRALQLLVTELHGPDAVVDTPSFTVSRGDRSGDDHEVTISANVKIPVREVV